jgi:DNA-binding GntR family transcriptional regulator
MPTPSALASDGLVKKALAEKLLAEIMNGTLSPGQRIIEGRWAQQFGVAGGTIREAINLLARDGFVTKEGGRSARVVNLTEKDVLQLYQMRAAVEGLAANLAAQDATGSQGEECSQYARLGS